MQDLTIDDLSKLPGKIWETDNLKRYYFNELDKLADFHCNHYKTGNISSASFKGEGISNCRAQEIAFILSQSKVFYDLKNNKFGFKAYDSKRYNGQEIAQYIIEKIKKMLAQSDNEIT